MGNSPRQGLKFFQQCRERKERKAEHHLESRKNKATNQVSLNLKFFPSSSFLEQMHTPGKVGISAFISFLSFEVLLWEIVFPWSTIKHSYRSVPPSISEKEGIQANMPGHQSKPSTYTHS